jgi:Type II secretion system (T2SS), protein M subtype b
MSLQPREKRLLIAWPIAMALFAAIYFWPASEAVATPEGRFTDIPTAEQRVARLRQLAASLPAREKVLDDARKELASREQGLVHSPTTAQQQAGLLQTVRRLARAQSIELQQSEIGAVQPFGNAYGEALVTVSFTCRIEQLVNLVADISAQKELIATREMQVRQAEEKRKTVFVRLTISAVTPKDMLPTTAGKA